MDHKKSFVWLLVLSVNGVKLNQLQSLFSLVVRVIVILDEFFIIFCFKLFIFINKNFIKNTVHYKSSATENINIIKKYFKAIFITTQKIIFILKMIIERSKPFEREKFFFEIFSIKIHRINIPLRNILRPVVYM